MKKLLIVDDNQQNLYMLQVLLSSNGFIVEQANNGAEALECARRKPPDMIISDILMPVMDGYALCRAWKQDEQLKNIPFVFYSATYTELKDQEFALNLGAARFIVKPTEPDKFLDIILETKNEYETGRLVAARQPIDVSEYYIEYNAALVRKLEDKMQELEKANRILQSDIAEIKLAEAQQKKLEEQLRQSQKLEAIGQLSSGVAHDFNNLLGGIMGHAELLKVSHGFSSDSERLKHFDIIISLCQKAADLTKQLLSFARKAPFELQTIDINAFIKQVAELMKRTIDRRVEIIVDIPDKAAFVSGDKNQLENALLNIAINARDAMPDGGKLIIVSETVDLKQVALPELSDAAAEGPYVRISIADTGMGMSKEIKDRIFEPFFTTKEAGKGTGLGLASVYGCVKQHNGYITVESDEGKGSRFYLYFPITESACASASQKEDQLLPGAGSLLVIDDEEIYHGILTDVFEPLGYSLHCCSDGVEAVEYYRKNYSATDVVILDMNMPRMSGKQCLGLLKEINPGVRVIITSGSGDSSEYEALQKEGASACVEKPYKVAQLSIKIAELMRSK